MSPDNATGTRPSTDLTASQSTAVPDQPRPGRWTVMQRREGPAQLPCPLRRRYQGGRTCCTPACARLSDRDMSLAWPMHPAMPAARSGATCVMPCLHHVCTQRNPAL